MPSVDLALQFIALQKERFIFRRKLVDDRRKGRPKPIAVRIRPREFFRIDEDKKDWVNANPCVFTNFILFCAPCVFLVLTGELE